MTHLRTLGRSGLLVSPLTLGTMTFGNPAWGSDERESGAVLDAFLEAGGTSIDTAEAYGASEELLGRLVAERGVRDRVVLATKYGFAPGGGVVGGSGRRNLVRALEGSLRRLGTTWVDLYWLHLWDGVTPAEELVEAMAEQVAAGTIRYYGLSNVPAWYAARVASLAEARGLPGPVALQVEYSLVARGVEREHVPAAVELGLGIVPWSPLAGGFLTGKYAREDPTSGGGRLAGDNPFGDSKFTDANWRLLDTLREVADGLGRPPAEVALAWVLARRGVDTVLVGARRVGQLDAGLAAAGAGLPDDARRRLDEASSGDPGLQGTFTAELLAGLVGGGTPLGRLRRPLV